MIALVPHQTWSLDGPASSDQREGLVQFWLHAPHDQLEGLWNSAFGAVTRKLVLELTPQYEFTPALATLMARPSADGLLATG